MINYKMRLFFCVQNMGERWGSNPRPPESQSGALPTELRSPYCTPGRTRTCNPRLRRPLLYPVELQAHIRGGGI